MTGLAGLKCDSEHNEGLFKLAPGMWQLWTFMGSHMVYVYVCMYVCMCVCVCVCVCVYIYIYIYIQGVPGGNVPDFGRMFLKLKYTDITKHIYIQSGDKGERNLWFSWSSTYCTWFAWHITRTLRMSILESAAELTLWLGYHLSLLELIVGSCKDAFCVFPRGILRHALCVWILRWQCTCCCWRIPVHCACLSRSLQPAQARSRCDHTCKVFGTLLRH